MNSKTSKDNAADLHDSTDWLTTPLPSLRAVEAALRCQVCKDLYTTPMITSCSHTFCSLCIRRCLTHDGKCPACRASDQEMRLRQNWAVGEMVEAFKTARPEILEFVTKPVQRTGSPKRKLDEIEEATSPLQKRTRSGRRIQSSSQVVVLDRLDDEDEGVVPGDEEPGDELVECPICQDRMTVEAVQVHIDRCMVPGNKKAASNPKMPPPRPERLPHPHYSGLKDTALRKKLADQGLNSSGSRQLMERRYTEWIMLWNANCDSKDPKGKSELKRELDIWERTQGGKANTTGREQIMGAQIRDKDFDRVKWDKDQNDPYKELIAMARAGAKSAGKAAVPELDPAERPIPGVQEPRPHGEARRAESQIQYDSRQDLPRDAAATASYSQYQPTPAFDEDRVNSDIAQIKTL